MADPNEIVGAQDHPQQRQPDNSPKIVQFSGKNINDLPARLRSLADMIENKAETGEAPETFCWTAHYADGSLEIGALGRCHNPLHAVGFLQAACVKLIHNEVDLA